MFSTLQKHTIANTLGPIAGQLKKTYVTFLGQCVQNNSSIRILKPVGKNHKLKAKLCFFTFWDQELV